MFLTLDLFLFDFFLEQVLEELKQNTKVKFKETDLFRVYQSIDLVRLLCSLRNNFVSFTKNILLSKLRSFTMLVQSTNR